MAKENLDEFYFMNFMFDKIFMNMMWAENPLRQIK